MKKRKVKSGMWIGNNRGMTRDRKLDEEVRDTYK